MRFRKCSIALSIIFVLVSQSCFANLPVTKIADTNTLIPGGTGNFTTFGQPIGDREDVLGSNPADGFFEAQESNGQSAIYRVLVSSSGPI